MLVAVGREGIGHLQLTLAHRYLDSCPVHPVFLGAEHGIRSLHEGGVQHNLVCTCLQESIGSVLFVSDQIRLFFPFHLESPFVVG